MKSKLARAPPPWRRVLRKCRSTRIDRVGSWTPLIDPFPPHFLSCRRFLRVSSGDLLLKLAYLTAFSHSISKRTYHAYRQLNSQASLYLYQKPHIRHPSLLVNFTLESVSTPDPPNGTHILKSDLTFRDLRVAFELIGSASSLGSRRRWRRGPWGLDLVYICDVTCSVLGRRRKPARSCSVVRGQLVSSSFRVRPRVATFRVSIEPAARFLSFVFG